jgi:hypothetical protein
MSRNFSFTAKQKQKLTEIQRTLEELKNYLPLTLRQIFYQLVSKQIIENTTSEYTMLSNLLKWARIEGYITWKAIEDRVRVFHDLTGWPDSESFIRASLKYFLTGYTRDLMQSQEKRIEIWIEKDALSGIFKRVASQYTVPVVVCRGFSSVSFLHDFAERVEESERKTVMLYFGDFDPSGVEMFDSMKITLLDEFMILEDSVEFKRVALTKEDVFKYQLPHNPNALKKSDTRANKHVKNYGELAVELDALRPDILEAKIRDGIGNELDIDLFNNEIQKHLEEINKLNKFKKKTEDFAKRWMKKEFFQNQ